MILPTLNYCDIVWQGCGQGNCDSLERLQRRAAKQIHPNSGIESDTLLLTLKLVLLTDRRKAHTSILVKKCLIGFVPPYFLNYFKLNESHSFYKTRDIMDISLPKVRLEVAKHSFYYTGAVQFNSLPRDLKEIQSLDGFTKAAREFLTV